MAALDPLDVVPSWSSPAEDVDPDADRDGLRASVEESGFTTEGGDTFVTDAEASDSDGDGLTDGEEAGALVSADGEEPVYRGISDPGNGDTDDDGVQDGDEYFLGTDPWSEDTDGDGLLDQDELTFGSDPLEDNPDGDDYSDEEERERGSSPMEHDESGWKSAVGWALKGLRMGLSAADKLTGGGKIGAAAKAMKAAKAAGVAAPVIWNAVKDWDWSELEMADLRDAIYEDDMDELGETLEGGQSAYIPFVGRRPDGTLAYAGVTDDFDQLTASHGGLVTLSSIGDPEPMPLGQARAVAEAVIKVSHDRMDGADLANTRHVIDPAHHLYAPATAWGTYQLETANFEW
jgi:hypothetical protein